MNPAIAVLAGLGRHGSHILPIGVFIGIALPPLAALMKPLLIPGIIGPFIIALLRMDWRRLADHARRPWLTGVFLAWLLIAAPILIDALLDLLPIDPGLHGNLVLMAGASPLMASASLALIIGLDAPLAVVLTFAGTAVVPLTLPPIALHLLGIEIDISVGELMLRLGLLVGGCFGLAWLLRRFLPKGFTQRHAAPLDGLAVIGLLVFAIAVMDGVTALAIERPHFVLTATVAVFGLNIAMQMIATLAFAWHGLQQALTAGLCSGNRNLGLLLAAMADRATTDLLILIAVAQFPIYMLPMLQRWLYRRWLDPDVENAPRR
jgi:BASS family bile acid:Na+ symporter